MGLTARDIMVEEVVCVQETMELDALMKLWTGGCAACRCSMRWDIWWG